VTQFARRIARPQAQVEALASRYPGCWAQLDELRSYRGAPDVGDWPAWCYLPMAASYAVVSGGGPNRVPFSRAADVGIMAALSAWRLTQGIYRFDPAVYDAVRDTPVSGNIPAQVLYQLPEWCVYVETPGAHWLGQPLHGFFAHLEHDHNDQRAELRLLLDAGAAPGLASLQPMPLHLGIWPLAESIERMRHEAERVAGQAIAAQPGLLDDVAPLVSLLLYLCSQASEIGDGQRRPRNPEPKKTKRGWKLFAADRPTTWDVGLRLGAALRRAYQAEQTGQGTAASGTSPRPHIRRAHWHGYWRGPLDGDRQFDLRWQPPIAVGVAAPEDLPAVVRRVD